MADFIPNWNKIELPLEDPVTRKSFPLAAATDIPVLASSEHLQDIFEMLLCGWSPSRISKHLLKLYGETIAPAAIMQYLNDIPPALLLPSSYLRRRINQIDMQIDATGEMAKLLKLASDRLDEATSCEDITGIHTPTVDRLMLQYWDMLCKYVLMMQSLGDMPSAPKKFQEVAADPNTPKLRTLRELYDDSMKRQLDETPMLGTEPQLALTEAEDTDESDNA
jgi:hypothetical protein